MRGGGASGAQGMWVRDTEERGRGGSWWGVVGRWESGEEGGAAEGEGAGRGLGRVGMRGMVE